MPGNLFDAIVKGHLQGHGGSAGSDFPCTGRAFRCGMPGSVMVLERAAAEFCFITVFKKNRKGIYHFITNRLAINRGIG